jgi:exopolyphosphatase/guanosine-5'-triphosphate,3'-diphosphate pyrophosphatase
MKCRDNSGMQSTPSMPVAPAKAARWPHHLAAIDMGSNSFRLEIGEVLRGSYRRIDYLKETVRLGAGLDADGLLTEEAAQRGLTCLAGFAQRLSGYALPQVRAVATQTLREARNRDAFLGRAETVLGHPIEVISGREEARLIFAGVARLQPSTTHRLVIDIGGRSTEMIIGTGHKPVKAESFQVGSVSLSMRCFPDGRLTKDAFRRAQIAAGAEFEEALVPFARRHWQEALGSSGTVGAVSQLLAASGITDGSVTPEGLRWCMAQCLRAGHIERLALPGLKEERRMVIAGGLAILYTLATHFGIDALLPARGALRQGVIFDLDERHNALRDPTHAHDMRDASARELQSRFLVDVHQADRVVAQADALYSMVLPRPVAALSKDQRLELRRELSWAAALHEMGMMVSHHDHHRHSAYMLAHVDAAGFSQSQQRRLAELVLAQRGSLRKSEVALASEEFAWQVLCLRLAIIKCHARRPIDLAALTLRRGAGQALLRFAPGWVERNPRTMHLLNEEMATWERHGPLRLSLDA